jgi:hypothetical protein
LISLAIKTSLYGWFFYISMGIMPAYFLWLAADDYVNGCVDDSIVMDKKNG